MKFGGSHFGDKILGPPHNRNVDIYVPISRLKMGYGREIRYLIYTQSFFIHFFLFLPDVRVSELISRVPSFLQILVYFGKIWKINKECTSSGFGCL